MALLAFALLLASTGLLADSLQMEVAETLKRTIEQAVREQGARGLSAAVSLPDGSVVAETFGFADAERTLALTPETRLLGGSTGKTFVAATALSLVEDGVLHLDRPISTWLGDKPWFERLPNHRDITLRMLLNHSSGMPDHIYQNDFKWAFARQHFKDDSFHFAPEELVAFVLDRPALAPAGERFAYSDTGYILVGLIIEAATGNAYYEELRQRVLEPLRLDAVVPSNSTRIEGLAPGYVSGGLLNFLSGIAGKNMQDGILNMNPAIEWTGGGLASNPTSLVRFYSDLFSGRLLSGSSTEELSRSTMPIPNRPDQGYGLGVFVIHNEEFGTYFHHSGWYPGYLTNVIYYRDLGIAVAVQYNQDYNADIYEPVKEIARAVKALLPPASPSA